MGQIAEHEVLLRRGAREESVHKMRVGIRRLRSALSLFRTPLEEAKPPFEEDLRWLQEVLGPARNWDVFQETMLARIGKELGKRQTVRPIAERSDAMRDAAYDAFQDALESPRYAALLLEIERWRHGALVKRTGDKRRSLDKPIGSYAAMM
jgi:CHAD domain-containing protein